MDFAGVSYNLVRENFGKMVLDYFTYLAQDTSMPENVHTSLMKRDVQIFLGLARIYRDDSTTRYLNTLIKREQTAQQVTMPATSQIVNKEKPVVREQKPKPIETDPNYKMLDDVVTALGIDQKLFENIASRLGLHTVSDSSGAKVSLATYERVKSYVEGLRE